MIEAMAGYFSASGFSARLGFEVAGLKHLVRLVVAVAGIDRADDRHPIQHRRLLRQILAELHAGQPRGDRRKRPANFRRHVRFDVPSVDVARPASHPQQNDALASRRRPPRLGGLSTRPQQIGQRQACQTRQTSLQNPAPASNRQPLAHPSVEKPKRMSRRLRRLSGEWVGVVHGGTILTHDGVMQNGGIGGSETPFLDSASATRSATLSTYPRRRAHPRQHNMDHNADRKARR